MAAGDVDCRQRGPMAVAVSQAVAIDGGGGAASLDLAVGAGSAGLGWRWQLRWRGWLSCVSGRRRVGGGISSLFRLTFYVLLVVLIFFP